MLESLSYKSLYRSNASDFDRDFLIPCYQNSCELWRGSGYFSLNSLCRSFDGILPFVEKGGTIKLVCSPQLEAEDIALITAGLTDQDAINCILRQIKTETPDVDTDKMNVICNMIHEGVLEIKIAFKKFGMYHEKIGVFKDSVGNKVAYLGSNNETFFAKAANLETFTIFKSWCDSYQHEMCDELSEVFQKMWNNQDTDLEVIDFSDALKNELFVLFKTSCSLEQALSKFKKKIEGQKNLYGYQERAIQEFVTNGYIHFYEMATGTGKTFTAVRTITELKKRLNKPLFVVVCVPQIDLQVQWLKALQEDGYHSPIIFGGISTQTTDSAIADAVIQNSFEEDDVICISTYDTFFGKVSLKLNNIDNLFLIVDEAHNLTPNQIKNLPNNVPYRLGLSATIQRFSENETKTIVKYFTADRIPPFFYGIEDAIQNGFLSQYKYYPVFVELNESEFSKYQKKTFSIATEMSKDKDDRDEELLNRLRTERSLIVKKASSKIEKLEEMTQHDYDFKNSVVYCGQGKDDEEPIIDMVTRILYKAGLSVNTFTSKTENRPLVLKNFESGYFDTLVAIKCFDEGVDVPKLDKIYIMASDTALRQTVQRRGRVLRVCRETGKSMAYIYDMITIPPIGYIDDIGAKSLVVNEFRRAIEYMRLSTNFEETQKIRDFYFKKYYITEQDFANEYNQ